MDRRIISRPVSEDALDSVWMPLSLIQEFGPSPDFVSLQDINTTLRVLWDHEENYQTLVSPSLVDDNWIEVRRNYYQLVQSTIRDTKKNFLRTCESIKENIESFMAQIVSCAKARELTLKAQLWDIAREKLTKWNQQLDICSEALEFLCLDPRHYRESLLSEMFSNDNFSKSLEFLDAGEIKFDPGKPEGILKPLQGFGKIVCHDADPCDSPLRTIIPKFIFGESGDGRGQFCRPWGVCSDATGRILVCDRSNNRIQIFNECGEFILYFGKEGSRPGEFNRPSGIDVDQCRRIIVADKDNHRIQVFTYSGKFMFEFGSQGTDLGQFMYPWDVATNEDCDVAVSDSKNRRVQLFNWAGQFIRHFDAKKVGIESPRSAIRFLDSPRGLCFKPDGKLLVTDFNNHRVLVINQSFTKAEFYGCEGKKNREFFRPQGIACDKSGKFAVADSKNYRIQVFDEEGKFLKSFGSQGRRAGQFDCPQGICFHQNTNIIVVDFNNNRVQVF